MEEEVKLPELGEGVESATVVGILVSEGDQVEKDQNILELETEKAVAQMPSPKAGKVKEIHVETNKEVSLGDLLMTLDVGDSGEEESTDEVEPGEGEEPSDKQEAAEKKKGKEAEEEPEKERARDREAKKEKKADDKAEKRDDQARREAAERAEREEEEQPEEAERRRKDEEKASPEPGGKKPAKRPGKDEEREAKERQGTDTAPSDIPAAPSTRRLARELGVELDRIEGSGEKGWITASDVKRAARATAKEAAPEGEEGEQDDWGVIRRKPMSSIRKTIAKRMLASQEAVAHVTHFDDADVTELEAFRQEHQSDFEGTEFTPLPFVVRAVLDALKDHPIVNAGVDLDNGEIIYKEYFSIGIAVATDRGLIVPVLRNAERLSIYETAQAIEKLSEKARSGDFELKDLKGGTFSVSNLGAIGGRYATPIINYPEAAVLLPGRARKMPMVRDDRVAVRLMLPLSLTYDHTLIDGAEAQAFLNDVKDYLEDPGRLLTR